jgi:DNA-binding transcriptional MerR regulator
MLKIGDFSKLTHVSIRMLRHYDEIGLLKPAHIERESGYRFYTAAQLPRLNRILALQDLGFSLKQISNLLEHELSPEQLRGMLKQKQAELEDHVRAEQERLSRVAARLSQIETEGTNPYDIVLKEVPTQWVASVRERILSYENVGYLYDRLFSYLAPLRVQGVSAVIWHDDSFLEEGIDAEALIYLSSPVSAGGDIQIYQLPPATMVTVVHHGSLSRLTNAYNVLVGWIENSGYEVVGPNRELYLQYTLPARPDDESYVTEIQFPVKRRE